MSAIQTRTASPLILQARYGSPGRVTTCPGDANLLRPGRVAVDGAGNTYVADDFLSTYFNDGSVKKFDSSFVFQTRIGVYAGSAPLDGTFCSVWGVAVGASGKVY